MWIAGECYIRAQVQDLVGDIQQVARITPVTFDDGLARGARALIVRSAGGMSFEVLVDRGLDLGWAEADGMPLAWRSPRGDAGPAFAEPQGSGWTRTFGGGLLTTCGLMSAGAPSEDAGEHLGLHGRASHLAADQVRTWSDWVGDDLVLTVEGRLVETSLGGPTLELRRRITTVVGVPAVQVQDTVTNVGAMPAPHMFRHHINLGFPLVRPGDAVAGDVEVVGLRGGAPATAWDPVIGAPSAGATEEVAYLRAVGRGNASVEVRRPGRAEAVVQVEWHSGPMPWLVAWRHPRIRTNVLAFEPSTCRDEGRADARAQGDLIELLPDESRTYRTTIRAPHHETDQPGPLGPGDTGGNTDD